jgi:serine/threonine protein kinase
VQQLLRGDPVHSTRQAAGRAADVYAVGVHLYKMLFLRYPFEGGDAAEMSQNILHGSIVKPSHPVHPEVEDLLGRMLCREWQERISVPDIMAHPAYLENLPSEVAVRVAIVVLKAWAHAREAATVWRTCCDVAVQRLTDCAAACLTARCH